MTGSAPSGGVKAFLSFDVAGVRLSAVILAILAVLGAIPILKVFLAKFIVDKFILSTVTVLLSAVIVYHLMLAETNSPLLEKHAMAFVTTTVLLILVAYLYVPTVREALTQEVSDTLSQIVTALATR